jgi:drug/metabolite transporter (DMT)-like permease
MKARTLRRIAGAAAIVAGAFLMWLSPEVLAGALLMIAGVALEVVGIALEHS